MPIRVFQADYQYSHDNMYPVVRGNFNMARLSTGIVLSFGTMAPPPTVTIACVASAQFGFPGRAVTVTATVSNTASQGSRGLCWSGQGVTGTDTTAKLDTTNLAPGTYTVNCGR